MIVNCHVSDCKNQLRFNCQLPVIEVDKVRCCVSFVHRVGSQNRDLSKIYPNLKTGDTTSKK